MDTEQLYGYLAAYYYQVENFHGLSKNFAHLNSHLLDLSVILSHFPLLSALISLSESQIMLTV